MDTEQETPQEYVLEKAKRVDKNSQYFLPREQIQKIIGAAKNLQNRCIVEVFSDTGVRVNELINIQIEDIDWENKLLHVKHGKGNKERMVPVSEELMKDLQMMLNGRAKMVSDKTKKKLYNKRITNLFINRDGNQMSKRAIYYITKECGELAGVKNPNPRKPWINPHTFRHSLAHNYLTVNKEDYRGTSMLLGHANINTTIRIYGEITMEELKDKMKDYTDYMRGKEPTVLCPHCHKPIKKEAIR